VDIGAESIEASSSICAVLGNLPANLLVPFASITFRRKESFLYHYSIPTNIRTGELKVCLPCRYGAMNTFKPLLVFLGLLHDGRGQLVSVPLDAVLQDVFIRRRLLPCLFEDRMNGLNLLVKS
jgi:hypothetical protein